MSTISPQQIKHISELPVYRDDLLAGVLKRTEQGCEFLFDKSFLQSERYSQLTYRIKKQDLPLDYRGVNLPPFFAGLLPEGLRFKVLVKQLKTSEDDLFSLLAAIGERTVGDVYVNSESISRAEPQFPLAGEIDFYEFLEDKMNLSLLEVGDEGLAGVQEKISAAMISFPVQTVKKEKFYILKLNPKDKKNLTQNEFQCLKLAKACGIDVNSAKIVYDKNKNPGLLVERFDRRFEKNDKLIRVHQEDACQFLNRYPADKYRLSFAEICEGINELATASLVEIMKIIQLYAFSYLIGNGDLHGKNISLQTDPKTGRVQLTPAYDLICTYLYKDRSMAIQLDGRDKNFKRKYFVSFGQRFGIQKKAMEQMLDKLIKRLSINQHLLLEIPNLTDKESGQLQSMLETRMKELS